MSLLQNFEELIIFPNLILKKTSDNVVDSFKNMSVEFKLGPDLVVGFLILDEFDLDYEQRLDLLSVFSETLNIFLGKTISQENSSLELSSPKIINLDRKVKFLDNDTWYRFSLVFEEVRYSVVILRKDYL